LLLNRTAPDGADFLSSPNQGQIAFAHLDPATVREITSIDHE
jgi:hypothetical protein